MFQSPQPPPALGKVNPHQVIISYPSLPQVCDTPTVNRQTEVPTPAQFEDREAEDDSTAEEHGDEQCDPIVQDEPVTWNPDRPTRIRNARKMYDATTGTFEDRVV